MVNSKKSTARRGPKPSNHTFKGCRDIVLNSGVGSTPGDTVAYMGTDAAGKASFVAALSPIGLTSCVLGTTMYTQGTSGNVAAPVLRGLYNKALDFQWYRITRARFVFVGNIGSTATGTVVLASYVDPSDVSNLTQIAYTSGTGSKSFDLASSSGKELSIPMAIDSSWKKISRQLVYSGATAPFVGTASTLVLANTVTDLCFSSVSVLVQGAPASTQVGTMYIDYDVEFKGVIDTAVNQ